MNWFGRQIANVDQAILVFSAVEPDFSTALLDRFLVLIEFNQIRPIICITKIDLMTKLRNNSGASCPGYAKKQNMRLYLTSSETDEGLKS